VRYYIVFILAFFSSFSVIAQTESLSGVVKYKNGNPVPNVTVAIKNTNKHVLTDERGRFKFTNIPYGDYELEVISIEVKQQSFHIKIRDRHKPATLIVEPSEVNLNEVVVHGKSEAEQLKVKGFAMNVVETQKIAVQSVQTNELLDRVAGVRVRQDGGLGSRVNYNINGLSGNAVKVFIDGVPTSNYGPTFSLNSIPPALIERIEVYKGVVPGHLSEDALGGAINIVLKQQRKKSLTTSYSYGSFNTHQWNATGGYNWENGLTIDGSAFYNYSDNNYKVWGKDIYFRDYTGKITESNGKKVKRFHDAYESFGGRFNVGFTNVKWADQFLLGTVLSKSNKEVQNGVTMQLVYGNRHNKRKSNVMTLLYSKKDLFTKGLSLKVDATYSYLHRQTIDTVATQYDWNGPLRYPDGSLVLYSSGAENSGGKTAAIDKEYTSMMRTNLSYQIVNNHSIFMNYLFNDFERKTSDSYQALAMQKLKNTRDLQKNIFSFTYESLLFSERLRTNLFYKFYNQKAISNAATQSGTDFFVTKTERKKNDSGYGVTLSYALFPNLYLLGSGERAIRMPSENEIFGNMTGDELVQSSFDLSPETSTNFNLGFSFGSFRIKEHTLNLSATFFYRDTKDKIIQSYSSSNNVSSQYKNLESVESKGVDIELNYSYIDKVDFRFNFSKFDVLYNRKYNEAGHVYNYYRKQICNEPSTKFNANVTYYHNNIFMKGARASIYYNINYVNSFLRFWDNVGSNNLDEVPSQLPMDLGLTYTFPKNKIVLAFDAKNIFDRQLFDNFGLQKPGRSFYGKITYFIF